MTGRAEKPVRQLQMYDTGWDSVCVMLKINWTVRQGYCGGLLMPTKDFQCTSSDCNYVFEIFSQGPGQIPVECPRCGGPVRQVFTEAPAVNFARWEPKRRALIADALDVPVERIPRKKFKEV